MSTPADRASGKRRGIYEAPGAFRLPDLVATIVEKKRWSAEVISDDLVFYLVHSDPLPAYFARRATGGAIARSHIAGNHQRQSGGIEGFSHHRRKLIQRYVRARRHDASRSN